jgi:predicted AlkP superfamily pyrophosphatase or phosphodiesterase
VFASALGAITGVDNRLNLKRVKRACVILVDGLGTKNLEFRAGHAPFLVTALKQNPSIHCGFPSTTATSISSFATGLSAGQHGMVGYQVFDRETQKPLNLLTGLGGDYPPRSWQSQPTVSEAAVAAGVPIFVVGPAEYEGSGFSQATMPGAVYVGAKSFDERVSATQKLLHNYPLALIYLYFPELDQRAHAFGSKSVEWLEKLEDLDAAVKQLSGGIPKDAGLLLTADHGIIDVRHDRQIYLDDYQELLPGLVSVGGDPRVLFVYFDSQPSENDLESLQLALGSRVIVAQKNDIIDAGWYGNVQEHVAARMPDVFLIANGETALYHRAFAKSKSMQMIGQHGALSQEELTVPLLKLGAFA